jgi:hypothetical protein
MTEATDITNDAEDEFCETLQFVERTRRVQISIKVVSLPYGVIEASVSDVEWIIMRANVATFNAKVTTGMDVKSM